MVRVILSSRMAVPMSKNADSATVSSPSSTSSSMMETVAVADRCPPGMKTSKGMVKSMSPVAVPSSPGNRKPPMPPSGAGASRVAVTVTWPALSLTVAVSRARVTAVGDWAEVPPTALCWPLAPPSATVTFTLGPLLPSSRVGSPLLPPLILVQSQFLPHRQPLQVAEGQARKIVIDHRRLPALAPGGVHQDVQPPVPRPGNPVSRRTPPGVFPELLAGIHRVGGQQDPALLVQQPFGQAVRALEAEGAASGATGEPG